MASRSDERSARAPGPANGRPWPAQKGLSPWLAGSLYAVLALAPVVLAGLTGRTAARPLLDAFGAALGLTAFAILLLEFALSGRYRRVSGRLGVDRTMRVHRLVAYTMAALIFFHPFLYANPDHPPAPWFSGRDPALALTPLSLLTGLAAWLLVAGLVITAIDRKLLAWRYETWRHLHAGGGGLVAALVAVHAFTADAYSTHPALAAFWAALLGWAAFTLVHAYLLRPWAQARAPYVVETVDRVSADTWELRVRPRAGRGAPRALRFLPGQFVWLKLGGRPFRASEHPFSISTAPEDAPTIGFTIKEAGDFTDRIGAYQPGTPAYLDGPHGHFVPDAAEVPTVYIAAGSGIGPVLSHLRAFRAEGDRRELTLIYAAETQEQLADRAELDALAGALNLTVHYVVRRPDSAWQGRTGLITRTLLDACLPARERARRRYFVCGSEAMMADVRRSLRALGIPGGRVVTGS